MYHTHIDVIMKQQEYNFQPHIYTNLWNGYQYVINITLLYTFTHIDAMLAWAQIKYSPHMNHSESQYSECLFFIWSADTLDRAYPTQSIKGSKHTLDKAYPRQSIPYTKHTLGKAYCNYSRFHGSLPFGSEIRFNLSLHCHS